MKKLFNKDEVIFAVIWIIVYVVSFSVSDELSIIIGIPKLITTIVGAVLFAVLYLFIRKNGLNNYFGLCKVNVTYKNFLYFIPLIIISSVNFWNGVEVRDSAVGIALFIISMCFVALIEEIIFRGLLFKGMCKSNVKTAIIVSSVTFGIGHIVNLLTGAPLFETMLQLVYATAIGFCYTIIFHVGGSIWPCIISHAFVNASSVFVVESDNGMLIIITVVQTVLSVGYGVWLLHHNVNSK